MDKTIDTMLICPPRSKPQTEEGLKEAYYKYPALIYTVHSRQEFDTCHTKAANKVAVIDCDDRQIESVRVQIPLNVFLDEFEEETEYFFLSVSSDRRRRNRICDDFVVRFSIIIDSNADEYLNVAENHFNLSNKMILSVIFLIVMFMAVFWVYFLLV